jgi:hypothetical protein
VASWREASATRKKIKITSVRPFARGDFDSQEKSKRKAKYYGSFNTAVRSIGRSGRHELVASRGDLSRPAMDSNTSSWDKKQILI